MCRAHYGDVPKKVIVVDAIVVACWSNFVYLGPIYPTNNFAMSKFGPIFVKMGFYGLCLYYTHSYLVTSD